jgi:hypothetical protein
LGQERAERLLGLTPAAIRQHLAYMDSHARPAVEKRPLDLHAIVFHLPAAEVKELQHVLRRFAGSSFKRSEALMKTIRTAARQNPMKGS